MAPQALSQAAVAVVIPCHNAAATLAATLESVQAQTHAVREVVVVDDGSTDDSAAIAERAGVRCVGQPCQGPGAARNRGVAETSAAFVAFLDADDCFVPDKLARQLEHMEATGVVMSCTDAQVLVGEHLEGRKNAGQAVPATITFDRLLEGNPIICSSVLVERHVFEAAGLFDEDPVLIATEDYDLWLRIARLGEIGYLDESLLHYRVWDGSLSDDRRFMRGLDRIMEKVLAQGRGSAGQAELVDARRAAVRLSAAYHLARQGEGREARALLAEARRLSGWSRAQLKIWLRSWLYSRR